MNRKSMLTLAAVGLMALTTLPGLSGSSQSSVSTSGNVTTIKGNGEQSSPPIKLTAGAYIVARSAGEGFMTITANNAAKEPVHVMFINDPRESYLIVVNDTMVKPGDVVFEISGEGAWTMTLTKPGAADAATLPLVLTAPEMKRAMSKPFKSNAGSLTIAYTYKAAPKGTGTIVICDVATGKTLNVGMMYAGQASGSKTVTVPAAGVFIAETTFPLASGGGEVKIAQ